MPHVSAFFRGSDEDLGSYGIDHLGKKFLRLLLAPAIMHLVGGIVIFIGTMQQNGGFRDAERKEGILQLFLLIASAVRQQNDAHLHPMLQAVLYKQIADELPEVVRFGKHEQQVHRFRGIQ